MGDSGGCGAGGVEQVGLGGCERCLQVVGGGEEVDDRFLLTEEVCYELVFARSPHLWGVGESYPIGKFTVYHTSCRLALAIIAMANGIPLFVVEVVYGEQVF